MSRERLLSAAFAWLGILAIALVGGAPPWTQVALSALALVLFVVVVVVRGKRGLCWMPLVLPSLIAIGWTALQLVPLPPSLVALVSPAAYELRADTGVRFMPLTLDVPGTLLELTKEAALIAVLISVATMARKSARAYRALEPLAWVGPVLALVAIGQRLTGAQTIFGIYKPHFVANAGLFGTLINTNHAASIFTLSSLIAAGLALEAGDGPRRALLWVASSLGAAGVLMTTSRLGTASFGVGALAFGLIIAARAKDRRGLIVAGVVGVLLVVAAVPIAEGLRARLQTMPLSQIGHEQKVEGWRDGAVLARHFWLTGVGRGAFEAPVEAYREHDRGVRLVYPEDGPIQMASEWGVPITLALMLLAVTQLSGLRRRLSRIAPSTLAAGCAVAAVALHELADFGLELPGVAIPFVIVLAVVLGRLTESSEKLPRLMPGVAGTSAIAGVWALILVGGAWAAEHTLSRDVERSSACMKAGGADCDLDAMRARHPASDHFDLLEAEASLKRKDTAGAMKHLNRALCLHPAGAMSHHIAAVALARMGRPGQAALEYRLAAEHGYPATFEELMAATGTHIVDAVLQDAPSLVTLASRLTQQGKGALADAAAARAVDVSGATVETLLMRVRVDAGLADPKPLIAASHAVLDAKPTAKVYAEVIDRLEQAGAHAEADEALKRANVAVPNDGTLLITAVKLRLRRNDLDGAQSLLQRNDRDSLLSLADRKGIEELRAELADRRGDPTGAELARARSRILQRRMQETNTMNVN